MIVDAGLHGSESAALAGVDARSDGPLRARRSMTTRILIVDDHAIVRAGLRLLVDAEEDLETVGEAGDGREAIFEARSSKPDVILMDVVDARSRAVSRRFRRSSTSIPR